MKSMFDEESGVNEDEIQMSFAENEQKHYHN